MRIKLSAIITALVCITACKNTHSKQPVVRMAFLTNIDIGYCIKPISDTSVAADDSVTIDGQRYRVTFIDSAHYVSVSSNNIFSYISLPEECTEISSDPQHPDVFPISNNSDTLETGFYKLQNKTR